jgi:hypothetical protein
MVTTAFIVEILVIGYTSFIWILPLLIKALGVPIDSVLPAANTYKDWAPLVALVLTALAYQIGWLLDYWTYLFFYYVPLWMPWWARWLFYGREGIAQGAKGVLPLGRTIKRKYINDKEFWVAYTVVHEKASLATITSLQTDLSLIRFSRTGVANFLGIGLVLLGWLPIIKSWAPALVCFMVAAMSLYLLARRWDMYYRKMKICWDHLSKCPVRQGDCE